MLLDILIALVSLTQPIVPALGITIFVPNVAVEAVIANSSVPAILIFTPVPSDVMFKFPVPRSAI